jgi:hypothetical protein
LRKATETCSPPDELVSVELLSSLPHAATTLPRTTKPSAAMVDFSVRRFNLYLLGNHASRQRTNVPARPIHLVSSRVPDRLTTDPIIVFTRPNMDILTAPTSPRQADFGERRTNSGEISAHGRVGARRGMGSEYRHNPVGGL